MGTVILAAQCDEPLIGNQAVHSVALGTDLWRPPSEIRRGGIPYAGGTVPRRANDTARFRVEVSGEDAILGAFEPGNRLPRCDVRDDHRAVCAGGEKEA